MSATNRNKNNRQHKDQYMTPGWTVTTLLEQVPLVRGLFVPGGTALEPCAGSGNIIRAIPQMQWTAVEIDARYSAGLFETPGIQTLVTGDFLKTPTPADRYDVTITNPPYLQSFDFAEKCLGLSPHVIMLLRLNWLGSVERQNIVSTTKPDIYVLTPRPCFIGKGSDACEYGWFHWWQGSTGKYEILKGPSTVQAREFNDHRHRIF